MAVILRLRDDNGAISEVSIVGPPGPKGGPGYTPVKGVDYCTSDEMVELVATFDDGTTATYKLYGEAVTE